MNDALLEETKLWLNDIYGCIEVRGKIFKAGDLLELFEQDEFNKAVQEYMECKISGVN